MPVESYATVHQLVSVVTGELREEVSAVGCVAATFPGGSMTGAPKLRTMEIIDQVEADARGVYSGVLGFFGRDGAADLSIVIRTIVARGEELSIGVGGGIVTLPEVDAEYEEALLKAAAPLRAVRAVRAAGAAAAPRGAWPSLA